METRYVLFAVRAECLSFRQASGAEVEIIIHVVNFIGPLV